MCVQQMSGDRECEECSICREPLTSEGGLVLECRHIFHFTCMETWMARSPTCPLCRASTSLPSRGFEGVWYLLPRVALVCVSLLVASAVGISLAPQHGVTRLAVALSVPPLGVFLWLLLWLVLGAMAPSVSVGVLLCCDLAVRFVFANVVLLLLLPSEPVESGRSALVQ